MIIFPLTLLAKKPAYKFFEEDGGKADFEEVLDEAMDADIIFFGEIHNDPICHWLQLELAKALHEETEGSLILGAEMFEADDQIILDEYFAGMISQKNFEKEAKLWKNYKTDYKPLIDFAKTKKVDFIATNVPRRYASLVSKEGFEGLDSLSPQAKEYIAPLPIEVDLDLPGYKAMEKMFHAHGIRDKKEETEMKKEEEKAEEKEENPHKQDNPHKQMNPHKKNPHKPKNPKEEKSPHSMHAMKGNQMIKQFKQAQAIKDATMAHFIMENFSEGSKFLHFNGTYHSKDFEGIVWFIKRDRPDLKILTIHSEQKGDIEELPEDMEGMADFILLTPETMTKTYE